MARIGEVLAALCALASYAATAAAAPLSLDGALQPYLDRYGMPALAAAVVRDGAVVAAGAVGTRRAGTNTPVTLDDRFHIGSDTKAMTALLAAMLVEEGKLRWDTTVADVFPELSAQMDAGLRTVTLTHLLSHASGVPADDSTLADLVGKTVNQDGNLDELRYWLLRQQCGRPLVSTPGTAYAYANMNYVIAGAMIERVTGRTWDELITERVFTPLNLRTAGLGNQASLGRIDAPLGHAVVDGKTKAFLSGPNGDNPPIIGPAGIAHMSVLDFARWAGWNAGEGRRGPELVAPATLRHLHTPQIAVPPNTLPFAQPGVGYGFGWAQVRVDWSPQPLLYHGGSNAKNIADIWVEPARDVAIVTMTNIATARAADGLRAVAAELYRRFAAPDAPALPPSAYQSGPPEPTRRPFFPNDTRRGVGR